MLFRRRDAFSQPVADERTSHSVRRERFVGNAEVPSSAWGGLEVWGSRNVRDWMIHQTDAGISGRVRRRNRSAAESHSARFPPTLHVTSQKEIFARLCALESSAQDLPRARRLWAWSSGEAWGCVLLEGQARPWSQPQSHGVPPLRVRRSIGGGSREIGRRGGRIVWQIFRAVCVSPISPAPCDRQRGDEESGRSC